MNKKLLWRTVLVLVIVAWSAWSLHPLTSVNLITYFDHQAKNKDQAYAEFWSKVITRTNEVPNAYLNLRETANESKLDLTRYFKDKRNERPDIKDANQATLTVLQKEAQGKIKLGLDLKGGSSFLVEMDLSKVDPVLHQQSLTEATKVLRKRLDKYGVAEPVLQPQGDNRILIQMPGLDETDKDEVRRTLQRTAYLEFRMVHKDNDELIRRMGDPNFRTPPGYEKMEIKERDEKGATEMVFVKKKTEMSGTAVKAASVAFENMTSLPYVSLVFTPEGGDKFGKLTEEHKGERMAILLDGEVYSAPRINDAIYGGHAQITGRFSVHEASELANVLQNPLEAPVKIVEERGVDPSLGKDAIQSGRNASIIGSVAVVVFMAFYYLFVGLIANFALCINILLLLAVMVTFGSTLTLPGIAGICLTVGMAVDANVLIYERVREELLSGKRIFAAISAGYKKAFGTIFDSHVTTLITSIILILLGTGPVQGFGVTLTIGICISLFTSLIVTRLVFDYLISAGKMNTLRMQRWVKETSINFLGMRNWGFALSWIMILAGVVCIAVRGHDMLGVDFAGGDSVTFAFSNRVEVTEIRGALDGAGLKDTFIQYQSDASSQKQYLNIKSEVDKGANVIAVVKEKFPAAQFKEIGLDKVHPTVGKEILVNAGWAVFWSLIGILVYVSIRFELPFAVGAVIATIHDVFMTTSWFALTGRQFSSTFVAAILTIIGYSVMDTIVVFDRIREDLRLGVHGTLEQIMNKAINQTLSRTILTGTTTLLATLSLYIFGGGAINDFAFCFLVGILTGTYSSIFIASPIVLLWNRAKKIEVGVKPKPAEDAAAA